MLSFRSIREHHAAASPGSSAGAPLPEWALGPGDKTSVSEIMRSPVVCVEPHQEARALCGVFMEHGISGAPVVDSFGRPVGMVSKTDVVRWNCERSGVREPTVAELMVPKPVCVKSSESIARAAAVMAFEGVHRVPIVDGSGHIVGIVSSIDVLAWLAREHGYVVGDGPVHIHG